MKLKFFNVYTANTLQVLCMDVLVTVVEWSGALHLRCIIMV